MTAVYIGNIGETIDFVLLEKLVKEDIKLVFIGPIVDKRFEKIKQFENVTWLGELPQKEAAKHMRLADVGIVPFVKTPLTKYLNPNKCYEYLACNLPVVSTDAFVNSFDQFVYFARSHEDFIYAALTPPNKHKAYSDFAKLNSWDAKAAEFVALIKALTSTPLPI